MGQSMAEKQMFLFMVGMMKSFEIMPASSEALPDRDGQEWLFGFNIKIKNLEIP